VTRSHRALADEDPDLRKASDPASAPKQTHPAIFAALLRFSPPLRDRLSSLDSRAPPRYV